MSTHEIIHKINTLDYEDLSEIFNELADLYIGAQGGESLVEPLKSIASAISNRIASGSWSADCITTAFWVLGKAVLIPESPDLVRLASISLDKIQTTDAGYQVLIALDNQMMAERSPEKASASRMLAAFRETQSVWNEDPELLDRVKRWLEGSALIE